MLYFGYTDKICLSIYCGGGETFFTRAAKSHGWSNKSFANRKCYVMESHGDVIITSFLNIIIINKVSSDDFDSLLTVLCPRFLTFIRN
jgi:hypothetical protein